MHASKRGAISADSLAPQWGPRLVRFYFFICADKVAAESAAIETLAEAVRSHRSESNPSALVRLAVVKSVALRSRTPNGDRVARAVVSLPGRQRLAVALSRGLGLGAEEAAEAMGIRLADAKRLLADGLLELHRLLFKEPDGRLENPCET